jgi:Flp pilus assembly pilin Flp
MSHPSNSFQAGQTNIEYALLLVLIAVIIIAVVALSGSAIARQLGNVANILATPSGSPTTSISPYATALQALADFQSRILNYYNLHGSWPRTWSPYNFTDLGLNPNDWSLPVDGLYLSPHGSDVGISNKKGDNLQVYVKDLNGNTLHLIDSWSIWCPVNTSTCYYHTVAPGNEVDISTIYVTGQ